MKARHLRLKNQAVWKQKRYHPENAEKKRNKITNKFIAQRIVLGNFIKFSILQT